MCGIIGYSGKTRVDPNKLKILLLYSAQRGRKATGIGWHDKEKKTFYTKREVTDSLEFLSKIEIPETNNCVAHTRNASFSSGEGIESAHPFSYPRLTGVHNGFVSNKEELNKLTNQNVVNDSRALYAMINQSGLEDTLEYAIGSMALAWIDFSSKLNLYRSSNPLYIGYIGKNLYAASDDNYLEAIECSDITLIPEGLHYVVQDGKVISKKSVGLPQKYRTYQRQDHSYKGRSYGHSPTTSATKKTISTVDLHPKGVDVPIRAIPFWSQYRINHGWIENDGDALLIKIWSPNFYGGGMIFVYDQEDKADLVTLKTEFPEFFEHLQLEL